MAVTSASMPLPLAKLLIRAIELRSMDLPSAGLTCSSGNMQASSVATISLALCNPSSEEMSDSTLLTTSTIWCAVKARHTRKLSKRAGLRPLLESEDISDEGSSTMPPSIQIALMPRSSSSQIIALTKASEHRFEPSARTTSPALGGGKEDVMLGTPQDSVADCSSMCLAHLPRGLD